MATAPSNPTNPTQTTDKTDGDKPEVQETVKVPKVLTPDDKVALLKKGNEVTIDVKMSSFYDSDSKTWYTGGPQRVKTANVTVYMEGQVRAGKIDVVIE